MDQAEFRDSNTPGLLAGGTIIAEMGWNSFRRVGTPDYSKGSVYFKLTGNNSTPVQISSISARVTERKPAPSGTIILFLAQGRQPALEMGFDLESGDTIEAAKLDSTGNFTGDEYMKTNSVTLAHHENLAFNISLRARDCDCSFVIDVKFADGRSVVVDRGGQPFRFVSYAKSYEKAYVPAYLTAEGQIVPAVYQACQYLEDCMKWYGVVRPK